MSMDYSADLTFGYNFEDGDAPKKFCKHFPRKEGKVTKFDENTGEKYTRDGVTQWEHYEYTLDGEKFENGDEFYEALAKKIGASYTLAGDMNGGVVHCLSIDTPETAWVSGAIKIKWLAQNLGKLEALGEKLAALGFKVGPPTVAAVLSSG